MLSAKHLEHRIHAFLVGQFADTLFVIDLAIVDPVISPSFSTRSSFSSDDAVP